MTEQKIIKGSCLCRKIRYQITGARVLGLICHCNNCRKSSGSAFLASSYYVKSQVRILEGGEMIRVFEDERTASGNVLNRSFCSNCGSSLFLARSVNGIPGDAVFVSSGTMDLDGEEWVPTKEVWCKDRYSWLHPFHNTDTKSTM
ncbi:DUF636 domain protein [Penicillium angulare]|uniref:DUF636 domain protein n=1 Tax=Penicillium angulare TaxID=116970 RepID=A0A9W9FUW2_9EURO|nr:DUF636 domain protein [Penicillium angulare]